MIFRRVAAKRDWLAALAECPISMDDVPPRGKGVIAWIKAEKDHCYASAIVIAQLAYWVRTKEGRQLTILQTRLLLGSLWATSFVVEPTPKAQANGPTNKPDIY